MRMTSGPALRSMLATMTMLALVGLAVDAQNAPVTIRAGLLIDGTGETIEEARLLIEDGVVTRVDRLRGAVTHDLSGLTVMPGLIDTHVHLTAHFDADGKAHRIRNRETESHLMLYAVRNAQLMLMAGFTTVQSLGGRLDAELREFIADGHILGPRVLTSLEAVTADTGGPGEIRAFIQGLAAEGADVVKVFASGSIRDGGERTLSDEQINAACHEAAAQGLRTAVHAYGTEVVSAVSRAGCTSIEHGNRYDDDVIELLAEQGTYLDPHLGLLYDNYFENRRAFLGVGNFTPTAFVRMEDARKIGLETFRRTLANEKVKIVFGSDAVAGAHGKNAEELIARVQDGGQKPMGAIVSATSLAAESLGLGDQLGTLAQGFTADLVAVEGNPLTNIETVRNVRWVMKGGRVVRNEVPRAAPSRAPNRRGRR